MPGAEGGETRLDHRALTHLALALLTLAASPANRHRTPKRAT